MNPGPYHRKYPDAHYAPTKKRAENYHRKVITGTRGFRHCSRFYARVILPLIGYGRGRLFNKPIPRVWHGRKIPGRYIGDGK